MRIKAPWSDYVSLTVAYPRDAKPGSLKAVFNFQGYGVGSSGFRPRKDYLSVSVNAHCMPNRQPSEFYAALRENELKGYGFSEEENKRRQAEMEEKKRQEEEARRELEKALGISDDDEEKSPEIEAPQNDENV